MKKMTKKNEKHGYFIQMMKKNDDQRKNRQILRPRLIEDDGEIFADISDEKMMTLYVCTATIKSFSSVPI